MKKRTITAITLIVLALSLSAAPLTALAESPEGWTVPDGYENRVSVETTDDGIVVDQLVQGTPSSHAVAVSAPVDVTTDGSVHSFEAVFRISMEEFVASGRNANDVWTGIGIMGKPVFINWRNNAADGYAKDSPGLFTRFFNYSGELRLITDVYHENYNTGTDTVDTWTLLNVAAGASAYSDITIKLSYEKDGNSTFYNLYINGKKISSGGELSTVSPAVLFPDGKAYFMIAMNTQEKSTNENSRVTVKSINGTSFVKEKDPDDSSNGGGGEGGCNSGITAGAMLPVAAVLLLAAGYTVFLRGRGRSKE